MHISKKDMPGENSGAGAPDVQAAHKGVHGMHGMVLRDSEIDYRDLRQFGRITIEHRGFDVVVTVDGFEFAQQNTGRQHVAKAIAWGRDMLAAKLEAMRLVPGGQVMAVSGMRQEDLDLELAARRGDQ